jgi:hypothetical protein
MPYTIQWRHNLVWPSVVFHHANENENADERNVHALSDVRRGNRDEAEVYIVYTRVSWQSALNPALTSSLWCETTDHVRTIALQQQLYCDHLINLKLHQNPAETEWDFFALFPKTTFFLSKLSNGV